MRSKLLNEANGLRTYAVVFDKGEEVMEGLKRFAESEQVFAAQVTAIGAFQAAELAFYLWEKKDYEKIPVEEDTEVLSLLGDIGIDMQNKPALHLHAVLGRRDGSTVGGHMFKGVVRPTLEVIVQETPAHLRRVPDAASGLALIDLKAS
ncbi:DNA-binding protein [Roseomonas sp. OT10]|uniref:PPC domain-containing DNA-binding protein n=1 Tax=Roseomonas cutis TaxID=2897332 RepID=UPI001E4C4316|nr:PPC domain-containing DNA-binding protein [Roseomonas sp. OT10]UFN48748.1 DNA-binding protein [Roseomonas sp. OT10]